MNPVEKLTRRKTEILKEIARLQPMRKGGITEQFLYCTRKDGSKRKRGPYSVYSFKRGKQTVSRRLVSAPHRAVYREQIETFRRFQQLTAELVEISQQLADLAVAEGGDEKKRWRS